ncbi:MAG TPA: glycosyltransferase family 4 protein [Caldilineaceae bacterium]|nr:glycosyltransferase family 4 protein [Caldilineaceae bacterium]
MLQPSNTQQQHPQTICFYSDSAAPLAILGGATTARGGAEKQIAHLMAALAERGHQIYLLHRVPYTDGRADQSGEHDRDGDDSSREGALAVEGITAIPVAIDWRRPWSLVTLWQKLAHLAPDLIYARLPDDFLWLLAFYAKTHKPTRFAFALAHDRFCNPWQSYTYHRWFHNPLYALGLAMADVVVVQHVQQRTVVAQHCRGEVVLIPNLIEKIAQRARRWEETTYDAIWVSQIRPAKQVERFLDVVAALPHRRFALVGGFTDAIDEVTAAGYRQRIAQLPNLHYLGLCTPAETLGHIVHSKVLLNTSSGEGFPNTMLEAWSVGVPVVSLLIDPGNVIVRHQLGFVSGQMDKFRADVEALLQSPVRNQQMGANGLRYVREHHGVDFVCRALLALAPVHANGEATYATG